MFHVKHIRVLHIADKLAVMSTREWSFFLILVPHAAYWFELTPNIADPAREPENGVEVGRKEDDGGGLRCPMALLFNAPEHSKLNTDWFSWISFERMQTHRPLID